MATATSKTGLPDDKEKSVSPYLLRPARTLEEYLRERQEPEQTLTRVEMRDLREPDA